MGKVPARMRQRERRRAFLITWSGEEAGEGEEATGGPECAGLGARSSVLEPRRQVPEAAFPAGRLNKTRELFMLMLAIHNSLSLGFLFY